MVKKRKKGRTNDKAVIYVRFSPRRNADDCHSCEAQIKICKTYCEFHKLEVIAVCKDEALSGAATDNRPGVQRAISKAIKYQASLVVYSMSRLARNTKETLEIAEQLDDAGADLCSTSEKIDTSSYIGRFFFRLLAIIAEMEREQCSERTAEMMQAYQKSGRRMSDLPPYGMDIDPKNSKLLIPNKDEHATIVQIHKWRMEGTTFRGICRKLNEAGIEPRKVRKRSVKRRVYIEGRWRHKIIQSILERIEE